MDPDPRTMFATELAVFEERKAAWLAAGAAGKWVVVKGTRALEPFDDFARAWRGGIEAFDRPGFMVKQVLEKERPLIVSHVSWHEDTAKDSRQSVFRIGGEVDAWSRCILAVEVLTPFGVVPSRRADATAMIDPGSEPSLVSRALSSRLGLPPYGVHAITHATQESPVDCLATAADLAAHATGRRR